ncbi:hypothetical protein Q1695_012666 [Nippostrongylus brasiliensis]|nr:hypothetical protein Q1695_012666 [Nippostrongylus brasiliensis]
MPKNKGKGGKNRRRGTNENDLLKRELDTKDSFETEENELPEHTKINENDEQEEGEIEFSYLGAESEDDEGEEEDNNMPSSESDESEGEKSEEEDEKGSESDEESDNFVREQDLAHGRGLKPGDSGGRNKYN